MRNSLAEEIADYWLGVIHKLAEDRENVWARGGEIELPPEFARVRAQAVRNYANAGIYTTFDHFLRAKDFALDLIQFTGPPDRILTVVRLFKLGTDIYPPWAGGVGTIVSQSEFVVYPGGEMPIPPPGIYVGEPKRYSGVDHGDA